jgi:uncharacterized tellurite resistance protein B-like protein|tara:strand:+ start:1045 stop:1530 length:486 start_codon:yes stop_codon:yes gene_type:complete
MYKLQLDREFSQELFSEQSREIRVWVVNAIANIVVADGIVEKHELVALQEAIGHLDSKEEIIDLMKKVKENNLLEVKKIKIDPDISLKIFFYLAGIAVIDGNLKKSEAELLKKCGNCLALDADIVRAVISWALKQLETTRKFNQDLKSSITHRDVIIESIN